MEPDFKEELTKILTEYIEAELASNNIAIDDTMKYNIEATVEEAAEAAIEVVDDFVNEQMEEEPEVEDPWNTGKTSTRYDEGTYGQSGANGYAKGEVSGKSGGQALNDDSDRWKDAWGDN